jgi:hypothetical protein
VKNEVVLIVPYFGKLPDYFNTFLKSIANKNFDLLFFSDAEKPDKLPANVYWHSSHLKTIRELIKTKIDTPVTINFGYKLCDLRPAFGLIFADYISAYTFWGSIDLDVCMGNFNKFLNKKFLETVDIFSGIKEYVSGSFFLVRNNAHCNNLFKKSKDWKKVFSTEQYLGFDECGGQFYKQLKAGKTFKELNTPIESFTEVLFKQPANETRLAFNNLIAEHRYGVTKVDKNKITYGDDEYLTVHYIYYKTWYSFYTNKRMQFPFYINRLGFFQQKPSFFIIAFSKNFWIAACKKIEINLKKLHFNKKK